MRISFTTLGCPQWDLDTICRRGREMGYDGVDFRGLLDTLDITTLPAFTTDIAQTKRRLDDAGLAVSGIASSIAVCDTNRRDQFLDEAARTIDVARGLDCQNIRVFGGGDIEAGGREAAAAAGRQTMQAILDLDGARELFWLFETHDHWTKAADCRLLLDGITDPAFGALWDVGHTARVGGESPADSLAALGDRVRHVHIKDALHEPDHPEAMDDGWRYVAPGTGQLPLAEAIQRLARAGLDPWLMFEHEKRWHPELPDPDQAFPQYAQWARATLAAIQT